MGRRIKGNRLITIKKNWAQKKGIKVIKGIKMDNPDYRRLDRIEEKIDKLSDLLIVLARTEERVISLEEDTRKTERDIEEVENRITSLERCVGVNSRTVTSINKLVWIIMSFVLTAFFTWIVSFPTLVK